MEKFKFLNSNNNENIIYLNEHAGFINLIQGTITNNHDFYFQFDEDEPVYLANGNSNLHITISPETNSNIIFNNNGKVFKIFAKSRND